MTRRAAATAIPVAAAVAAFARSAGYGFLFWDDRGFIAENLLIVHPSAASLVVLWTRPLLDLYAPLTYSLWAVLSALFGPEPRAFHLTNVALHAVNAGLVFALLRHLIGKDGSAAALAGALLFAVHPVQCEAVAWASETKDLLSALFSLLAMREYLVYREHEDRRAYLAATAAFAGALLAKPSAVVAPVLLVILNRLLYGRDWRDGVRGLTPWFVLAAVCAATAAYLQPAVHNLRYVPPIWLRPAIGLDSLTFYLGKIVVPLRLVPDYGRTSEALVARGVLVYTWIPAAALLIAAWWLRRRVPPLAGAVALFVAALLPVLGLLPFDFQHYSNVADHYVYLAMLGPALGLAFWLRTLPPLGRLVLVAPAIVTLLALSIAQAGYWRDDITLYTHTLSVNPRSFMAHNNMGQILEEQGKLADALAHYRAALDVDPGDWDALNNVGNVLYKQGRYDDAIRHYTRILGPAPAPRRTGARIHNNLGAAYLKKSMYDDAAGEFRRALAMDADYLEPYYNLGSLLLALGHPAEAVEVLRKGLAVNPHHALLRSQLEAALAQSGR